MQIYRWFLTYYKIGHQKLPVVTYSLRVYCDLKIHFSERRRLDPFLDSCSFSSTNIPHVFLRNMALTCWSFRIQWLPYAQLPRSCVAYEPYDYWKARSTTVLCFKLSTLLEWLTYIWNCMGLNGIQWYPVSDVLFIPGYRLVHRINKRFVLERLSSASAKTEREIGTGMQRMNWANKPQLDNYSPCEGQFLANLSTSCSSCNLWTCHRNQDK